jgi:hypothetical protein
MFYPPRIVSTLLAGVTGPRHLLSILEWELVLHVYLAAVFAYVCARRCGLWRVGALLTAVVFSLGGYFASQAEHIGAVETAAWVPAILAGVVSWNKRTSLRSFLEVSGAFSMATLAGFTPLLMVLYFACPFLVLALTVLGRGPALSALRIAGAVAASWLLSAIILLPAAELASLSVAQFRADWRGTGGGIPTVGLLSLVWPDLYHVLEPGKYTGPWDMTFVYLYCGVLALSLALAAGFRANTRIVRALILLIAVSGMAMLGDSTPIGKRFFLLLPEQIRGPLYPQHWMVLFTLSLALLSGFGLQYFIRSPRLALGVVALAALDLIAVSSGRPFNTASAAANSAVTEDGFEGSKELLSRVRQASASAYPAYRIDTYGDSINWVQSAPVTGVPTAGGYDPLALVRYMQVRLAFSNGQRWGAYYQVDDPSSPVLGSLNVRYLIARKPIPLDGLSQSEFRLIGELPGHTWYENSGVLPRFFFVPRAIPVPSVDQALSIIRSPSWRPAESAALEAPPSVVPAPGGTGTVRVLAYRLNSIDLRATASSPALLASSEVHYPGWRAFVDGREVPIYFCNVAFRGILVPTGTHQIRFRFVPSTVIAGGIMSALAWLVWGISYARLARPAASGAA